MQSQNDERPINGQSGETTTEKSDKVSGFTKRRLIKNLAIIAGLILIGAVVAHFGLRLATRQNARRVVPNMSGLLLSEATQLAKSQDLQLIINDSLHAPAVAGGTVLDQLPEGGVEVKPGRKVYIVINAFNAQKVDVPYVAGRSLRQAKNMLEVAGLQIEKLEYRADMATNYVLAQYHGDTQITAESVMKLPVGTGITLHVGRSHDDPTTIVPSIVGLTLAEAKSRLWEMGLNIGEVKFDGDVTPQNRSQARVISQGLYSGAEIMLGRSVAMTLDIDIDKVDKVLSDIRKEEALRAKLEAKAKAAEADSLARAKIEAAASATTTTTEPQTDGGFFD
ncbi:MAG: PASTA domain-containing protein [Rikenellaceae bacterium]